MERRQHPRVLPFVAVPKVNPIAPTLSSVKEARKLDVQCESTWLSHLNIQFKVKANRQTGSVGARSQPGPRPRASAVGFGRVLGPSPKMIVHLWFVKLGPEGRPLGEGSGGGR